jgi:hypothetical protein
MTMRKTRMMIGRKTANSALMLAPDDIVNDVTTVLDEVEPKDGPCVVVLGPVRAEVLPTFSLGHDTISELLRNQLM